MIDRFNARAARRTRAQLIEAEGKRRRDHAARLEGLRAEKHRVEEPLRVIREAQERVDALSMQIDAAVTMNAEARREFQLALVAAADPRLVRLRDETERIQRNLERGNNTAALRHALALAEWREEVGQAIGDPEVSDDAMGALILRGSELVNVARGAANLSTIERERESPEESHGAVVS